MILPPALVSSDAEERARYEFFITRSFGYMQGAYDTFARPYIYWLAAHSIEIRSENKSSVTLQAA